MELEARGLAFSYDGARDIFKDVSFSFRPPGAVCILGPNGTGKSTLLKCLTGELKPRQGEVLIDGENVRRQSPGRLAKKIAYIAQSHSPAFPYPVIDVVMMGRTSRMGWLSGPGRAERELAMKNLEYLKIGHLRDKAYTDISGGERQLVMLAAALTQEPETLILDEPTAHLDFGNQYRFIQLAARLRDRGMGVIMTTHFPEHALELGGRTILLREAGIAADGPAAEVVTEENMERLYGIEVHVKKVGSRSICVPGPIRWEE